MKLKLASFQLMLHNLQISMVDIQTPTQFNSDLIGMLKTIITEKFYFKNNSLCVYWTLKASKASMRFWERE